MFSIFFIFSHSRFSIFSILPIFLIFFNFIFSKIPIFLIFSPFYFFILSIFPIFTFLPTLFPIQIFSLLSSHSTLHFTLICNFLKFHLISTSHYNFPKFSNQVLFPSDFVSSTSKLKKINCPINNR